MIEGFWYVSRDGLLALADYRYSGEDKSILAWLIFRRHWDWAINFFPIWMAPNMITLLGFLFMTSATGLVLFYSPDLVSPIPSWVFLWAAFCIYLYQIFDNCDGRQARRTGTSGPLGELFDHGCDSLFVAYAIILMCAAMSISGSLVLFPVSIIILPFYAAHYEEYHTGKLILSRLGNPTEGQWIMIIICVFAAVMGPDYGSGPAHVLTAGLLDWLGLHDGPVRYFLAEYWDTRGFHAANLFTFFVFLISLPLSITNFIQVVRRSSNLVRSALLLVPFFLYMILPLAWFFDAELWQIGWLVPHLVIFVGLLFSYVVDRMLIARICQTPFNVWNPIFGIPMAGFLFSVCFSDVDGFVLSQVQVFFLLYAVLVAVYVHFIFSIVYQFKTHLGIRVLTIPYPPPSRRSVNDETW